MDIVHHPIFQSVLPCLVVWLGPTHWELQTDDPKILQLAETMAVDCPRAGRGCKRSDLVFPLRARADDQARTPNTKKKGSVYGRVAGGGDGGHKGCDKGDYATDATNAVVNAIIDHHGIHAIRWASTFKQQVENARRKYGKRRAWINLDTGALQSLADYIDELKDDELRAIGSVRRFRDLSLAFV